MSEAKTFDVRRIKGKTYLKVPGMEFYKMRATQSGAELKQTSKGFLLKDEGEIIITYEPILKDLITIEIDCSQYFPL